MSYSLVLTCEHASAAIPPEFKELFSTHSDLLKTHSALDIGADILWEMFKNHPSAEISLAIKGEYSRLIIDLNRSEKHPRLFSPITKNLDKLTKKSILQTYYQPYRQTIIQHIAKLFPPILHLSLHTFTPILNNKLRDVDIGLLYDPQRPFEKMFSRMWAKKIKEKHSLKVRMNSPYYGKSDGLTSFLRKHYSANNYAGLELEVNQKFFLNNPDPEKLIKTLTNTFFETIDFFETDSLL